MSVDASGVRMNLVYKGMVLEAVLVKLKATREPSFSGHKWYWRTKTADYTADQKPMFERVAKVWEKLPEEERRKYSCSNYSKVHYPTASTARTFLTGAKTQYLQHKNK